MLRIDINFSFSHLDVVCFTLLCLIYVAAARGKQWQSCALASFCKLRRCLLSAGKCMNRNRSRCKRCQIFGSCWSDHIQLIETCEDGLIVLRDTCPSRNEINRCTKSSPSCTTRSDSLRVGAAAAKTVKRSFWVFLLVCGGFYRFLYGFEGS